MRPPYPPDYPPYPFDDAEPVPRAALNRIGLLIFLASLVMLFGASMLGYVMVRFLPDSAPRVGWMSMPAGLWLSTFLLIASACTIHLAQRAGADRSLPRMRRHIVSTMALAIGFIAVQTPCLLTLLRAHDMALTQSIGLYGLVFTLIVLHALHVVGGLVPLIWLTWKSHRGRLTLGDGPTVRTTGIYWHFLDAVWLIMFGVFLLG